MPGEWTDPVALIRQERAMAPPSTGVRRVETARNQDEARLITGRLDPRAAGYHGRMQQPEPDGASAATVAPDGLVVPVGAPSFPSAPPAIPSQSVAPQRLVLSFGPQPGLVIVSLEQAPDWDVAEGDSWVLDIQSLRATLPLFQRLTRIKDLTAGAWRGPRAVEES